MPREYTRGGTLRRITTRKMGPDVTHTTDWDRRSLGLFEANILRAVWGPHADHFATRDSSNSQHDVQDLGDNVSAFKQPE
jgi:hypothetical protein